MSKGSFEIHGKLAVSYERNFVVIEVEGPCNIEFFRDMAIKLTSIAPELDLDNYVALIILKGEALALGDAMSFFTDYLKTVHVKAVGLSLEHALTPKLTEQLVDAAYTEAGIKHAFFMQTEDARLWLRQQLTLPRDKKDQQA